MHLRAHISDDPNWRPLTGMLEEEFAKANGRPISETLPVDECRRSTELFRLLGKSGRSALCLSGGGIRSASFNLGVLQGLSNYRLLKKFDYLSTVSGGGFIGSWFTALLHRHNGDLDAATDQLCLANAPPPDDARDESLKIYHESKPIQYLRDYSNYLTPRLGLLSIDTWTLAATYLRNLLVNWLALVPLFIGIVMIPRLYMPLLLWFDGSKYNPSLMSRQGYGFIYSLAIFAIILAGFAAGYPAYSIPSLARRGSLPDSGERHHGSAQRHFLIHCLIPAAVSCLILCGCAIWYNSTKLSEDRLVPPLKWCLFGGCGIQLTASIVYFWGLSSDERVRRMKEPWHWLAAAVIGPAVGLLIWGVGRTYVYFAPSSSASTLWWLGRFACVAPPLLMLCYGFGGALYVALTSRRTGSRRFGGDEDREWWARAAAWSLAAVAAWSIIMFLLLFGPKAFLLRGEYSDIWRVVTIVLGVLSGVYTIIAGKYQAVGTPSPRKGIRVRLSRSRLLMLTASAAIFIAFLIVLLSIAGDVTAAGISQAVYNSAGHSTVHPRIINELEITWNHSPPVAPTEPEPPTLLTPPTKPIPSEDPKDKAQFEADLRTYKSAMQIYRQKIIPQYQTKIAKYRSELDEFTRERAEYSSAYSSHLWFCHQWIIENSPPLLILLCIVGLVGFGGITSLSINFNAFSLHSMYRSRIIRAYLGASRDKRNVDDFTRFDPEDNVQMHELRQTLVTPEAIRNCGRLIERILSQGGPMERILCAHWDEDSKAKMRAFVDLQQPSSKMREEILYILCQELNRLMTQVPLYKEIATLPPQTAQLFRRYQGPGVSPLVNRVLLAETLPNEVMPSQPYRPFHILNMTLNLVKGADLAWQERKAESFTVSSLHCGNIRLGYRNSMEYGDGISLGTATTISGAAASPNMGQFSSPTLTFLMAIFNARLGAWLGNPGRRGVTTFRRPAPKSGMLHILAEAFGLTDDHHKYVYLSDGGHFDNLGLYEMVLRRCNFILVCDAGCDPEFHYSDLGNAIRKIRADLHISIDMDRLDVFPSSGESQKEYCAVGAIRYSDADGSGAPDGFLLYIKPTIRRDEPIDVLNYKATCNEFPHESTIDQWFKESQFESYRALGMHIVKSIMSQSNDCPSVVDDSGRIDLTKLDGYKPSKSMVPIDIHARPTTRPPLLDLWYKASASANHDSTGVRRKASPVSTLTPKSFSAAPKSDNGPKSDKKSGGRDSVKVGSS